MPDLITKIGADSSQLRQDVGSLPSVVKGSFDKMKSASSGGIDDNIKGIKRSVNGLKDLLVGGGIVTAVVAFYKAGISEAERGAAAGNKFAESFLEIRDVANSAINGIGKASVAVFGGIATSNKVLQEGFQNIGALLTGNLGSLQASRDAMEETGKAARKAEASLAEAKKHAAEFQGYTAEIKTLTEAREAAERKMLPIGEQRAILEQQLLEAQRAQVDAGDNALARRKAQVEELKTTNALLEVQKTINDESDKMAEKRRAEAQALHKTEIEGLELKQREAILIQEISDSENLIASGILKSKEIEEQRAILSDRRNDLLKVQNKLSEESKKMDEAQEALDDKRNEFARDLLTSQKHYLALKQDEADLIAAIAEMDDTPERLKEEARLLDIQKKTREAMHAVASDDKSISELLLKGRENLNDVEKERLKLLTGETTQAKQEAELHEITVKLLSSELLPAEKERLQVLIGQTKEAKDQNDEAQKLIAKKKIMQAIDRVGSGYDAQSTTALEGVIARLRDNLAAAQLADRQQLANVGGTSESFSTSAFRSELYSAQKELDRRREIADYSRRYGEEATIRQYGDTLAEKALRDVRDTGVRTANALEIVVGKLSASPLFKA